MLIDLMPFGRIGSAVNVAFCSIVTVLALLAGLSGDALAFTAFWALLPLDLIFVGIFVWVRRPL